MHISVVEPVGRAIERTRIMLFRPFRIEQWFGLGFCAWLSQLAAGGGGGANFQTSSRVGGGGGGGETDTPGELFRDAGEFVRDHLALVLVGALCILVASVLIGMLLTWLSSRGHFMFLDGVARDRGAVREPWSEFRREANSLFWFRFWFGLATTLAILVASGVAIALAIPDIRAKRFGAMALAAIIVGATSLALITIAAACVRVFLLHFVVPIMYLRRMTVTTAWGVFSERMLANHIGTLALYVLFQVVLSVAVGILALLVTCATCCIAALPYIGTVILLPLHVFGRTYSIYFLEQFGPEWTILQPLEQR